MQRKIHQGTSPNSHSYQMNQANKTAPNWNENLVTNKRFTLLRCYSSLCFYGCYCHVQLHHASTRKKKKQDQVLLNKSKSVSPPSPLVSSLSLPLLSLSSSLSTSISISSFKGCIEPMLLNVSDRYSSTLEVYSS